MVPWELKITRGANGYRLSWLEDGENGEIRSNEVYIQEPELADDREAEAKTAVSLFFEIMEHFGLYGSKHDRIRAVVKLEHGSNWECKDKKCEICD